MLDEHFNETIFDEMSEATLCCDSATFNEFNQRNESRWYEMILQTTKFCSIILCITFRLNYFTGEVLLSIKTAIVGSDGVFLNWRQEDPDPCSWRGVTCDSSTKRIIHL